MDELIEIGAIIAKFVGAILVIVLLIAAPWQIWGDRRVEHLKTVAPRVLSNNGFDVIGYQGYNLGLFITPGGCVWYTLKREAITYQGCVSQWGSEYHIYNLKALDAISTQ